MAFKSDKEAKQAIDAARKAIEEANRYLEEYYEVKMTDIKAGAVFLIGQVEVVVSEAQWDSREAGKRFILTGLDGNPNKAYMQGPYTLEAMYDYLTGSSVAVRKLPHKKVVVIDTDKEWIKTRETE